MRFLSLFPIVAVAVGSLTFNDVSNGLSTRQGSVVPTINAAPAYTTTGTKTIGVYPGGPYAYYHAWTRACTTGTVESCSESWVERLDTYDQTGPPKSFNVTVVVDNAENCAEYGPTFQVMFTSSYFGNPETTIYHTADVCYPLY